jgi:hypothetical protein
LENSAGYLLTAVTDLVSGGPAGGPRGKSIPAALRDHIPHTRLEPATSDPRFARFADLVESTPALRDDRHRIWMRHQTAIAADIGADPGDAACAALARLALETPGLARGPITRTFDLLEQGLEVPPPQRLTRCELASC